MAIHQPHDHLFRRVFGVPQEAASFLQAALPAALRRALRWSTLKRDPASYVTPDLHGAASDLLFEVRYAKPTAVRSRLWLYLQPLFRELEREPDGGGQDDLKTFVQYMVETGPDDTPDVLDEILSHTTAEMRGELMRTSGERLRQEGRDEMRAIAEQRHQEGRREGRREGQREGHLEGQREGRLEGQREGRLEGQREGRLETIDGLLRTGVDWSVIEQATGIGEQEFRKLKRQSNGEAAANGDGA